jgi:hypothetical protein
MPGLFETLIDRVFNRNNTQPQPTQPTTDTSPRRDAVRGLNYEEGRRALQPQPAQPQPPPPSREAEIRLPKGKTITLTANHVKGDDESTWEHVAEQNGSIAWRLKQANEGVAPIKDAQIYVPSTEEMLYADCLKSTGDPQKAARKYTEVSNSGGLAVLKGAREAASGKSGESYGTAGVGGVFYASNPELAGASSKRTVQEGGKTLYKISWGSNFWKCNLFANESVYRGGFKPSMQANKHYTTAGALHKDTKTYQEVAAASAYAGCVTVFGSGGGSNESHTGILGSMPIVTTDADGNTVVEFTFIGASSDRAKEQDKKLTLKKGTNEILAGDHHERLRFLKPLQKRT